MNSLININGTLYIVKRSFKMDGWFDNVVKNLNVDELLTAYHCDKLLKANNEKYHLVNEIKDAEIIDEIEKISITNVCVK